LSENLVAPGIEPRPLEYRGGQHETLLFEQSDSITVQTTRTENVKIIYVGYVQTTRTENVKIIYVGYNCK
jgi:hypothetical protein